MSEAPAYVPFWIDRFVSATASWTAAEVGAYVRLLLHQATHGHIPADAARLARIAGMDTAAFAGVWSSLLREKFQEDPDDRGRLRNPRMDIERSVALARGETNRQRARAAAKARWRCSEHTDEQCLENTPSIASSNAPLGLGLGISSGSLSGDGRERERGEAPTRRDGAVELRAALETFEAEHGQPLRSDVLEACEAYRARRVKTRHGLWDRDQWLKLLRAEHRTDPLPLVEALRAAEQAGWGSVHPRRGRANGSSRPGSVAKQWLEMRGEADGQS